MKSTIFKNKSIKTFSDFFARVAISSIFISAIPSKITGFAKTVEYISSKGIKMTEHFAPWKVKFDIDFEIKPVMTDDEKVAEHKLVSSLMAAGQKMGFSG